MLKFFGEPIVRGKPNVRFVGDVDSNSKDYISICILEEWLLH